jgi:hypothetical protein
MSQQMEAEEKKQHSMPTPTAIKYAAGGTMLATLPFDVLAHFGPTGILVGGMLSYVVYKHGQEAYDMARDTFPFLPALRAASHERGDVKVTDLPAPAGTPGKRSLTDRMFGVHPEQAEQGSANVDGQETAQQKDATGFVTVDRSSEVPGVPRYTVEEIAEHIQPNSYKLYVGRSLTLPEHPALHMSFWRRHLKVIGASQKGKSSMAAALLDIILRTHDAKHVLVALLDMENRTSKLFENDPHIARVRFPDGKETLLHARSKDEVLAHLELLVQILDYRATLTVAQVSEQPLMVIYLEEFLLLKKELKQRASRLTGEAKEQAQADYERFILCVNLLAGRGLKYGFQFLICAQVDYRDDDLYEAFANITAGFCFCVRATAAGSAGFMQTELLNRNAKDNKVGQCVVETPDGHDLILAPEYDLEAKLTAYEAQSTVSRNNVAMRAVRPGGEPTHSPNSARTEQENEGDFELADLADQGQSARTNSGMRPPVEPTHTVHSDAQPKYPKLNATQLAMFVASYEVSGNIDKSLSAARADTRYREHARAIIADLNLKRKDA